MSATANSIVDPHTVLIVSEDSDFPRQLTARWHSERRVPSFTVVGSNLRNGWEAGSFDLAVVAAVPRESLRPVLRALDSAVRPVIVVTEDAQSLATVRREFPRIMALPASEGWQELVLLLGREVLRRMDALQRAERAEYVASQLKCQATLGLYVIEMRHTFNNALTSVLGNAELLLLEPGTFSADMRSQLDTIRNMALRMHEILQRFSSLEKELTVAMEQAAREQKTQAVAVGQ